MRSRGSRLDQRIKRLSRAARELIDQQPGYKQHLDHLRQAKGIGELSAVRHDPNVKAFYEALQRRGKKKYRRSVRSCANTLPVFGLVPDSMSLLTRTCFFVFLIGKVVDF
jgi:hypothetical protein